MSISINISAITAWHKKFDKMHNVGMPIAVRTTLNSAAFDVKQRTMPASAKKNFVERKKTFFKANSRVETAKGMDIKGMQSEVGFKDKGGNDQSVEDLEQQEHGGQIKGRSMITTAKARVSGNWNKQVKAMNRTTALQKIVNSRRNSAANNKQQFIKSAVHAGVGGLILGNRKKKGSRFIYRINKIGRKGGNTFVGLTPLYSVRKGRSAKVKRTNFMRTAAEKSAGIMEKEYFKNLKKQQAKYLR